MRSEGDRALDALRDVARAAEPHLGGGGGGAARGAATPPRSRAAAAAHAAAAATPAVDVRRIAQCRLLVQWFRETSFMSGCFVQRERTLELPRRALLPLGR